MISWLRSLALALPLVLSAAEAQTWSAEDNAAADMLERSQALVEGGEPAEAERMVRPIIEARSFRTLDPDLQLIAHQILAATLFTQLPARCDEALQTVDDVLATVPRTANLQRSRYTSAIRTSARCRDDLRATRALNGIVRDIPDLLAELRDSYIIHLAQNVTDPDILSYLTSGGWRPADPASDLSWLRLRLVRLYVERRDIESAREAAQGLIVSDDASLGAVVVLLVDKSFDAITMADPNTYNFDNILHWQVSNLEARAAATPDSLALQIALAHSLYSRNLLPEALAVIDAASARIAAASEQAPAFADQSEQVNWLHNERSTIMNAMGRTEDALAAMQEGIEAGEDGADNISQLLNRAGFLLSLGRPNEVLEHVARSNVIDASPYGRMVALGLKACAESQLNETRAMRETLRQMQTRAEDSLNQLRRAALCANDLALAARTYRTELASDDRERAMLELQRFLGEDPQTEFDRMIAERSQTMSARPEVRAAIARAARVTTFPIRRPYS